MSSMKQSVASREQGNAFYKSGQLQKALNAYHEAAASDPADPKPLSNLSAAYFETGQYVRSIEYAEKALELQTASGAATAGSIETLRTRISKAQLHLRVVDDQPVVTARRVAGIPRYRASMHELLEFFPVGHDDAESISDQELFDMRLKDAPANSTLDFFLAGIGDARHLFTSIFEISQADDQSLNSNYRFVVNDIKPAMIARDLLVVMLIRDLTEQEDSSTEASVNTLNTLHFLYTSRIVPPQTIQHIQATIDAAIDTLNNKEQPVPWFRLQIRDFTAIIDVLRGWKNEAINIISPTRMVARLCKEVPEVKYEMEYKDLADVSQQALPFEELLWTKTGFLYPAVPILQQQSTELKRAVLPKRNTGVNISERAKKIRSLIGAAWSVNPTMLDLDLRTKHVSISRGARVSELGEVADDVFAIPNKVLKVEHHETPGWAPLVPSTFAFIAAWFWATSRAINKLKNRIMVHAVLGDFANVLDEINIRASGEQNGLDGIEQLPKAFDRMHFSNVPDYTGGHLSIFVTALPLLKPHSASWLTFNCLKNSGLWRDNEHMLAEYLLASTPDSLDKLFQAKTLVVGEPPLAAVDYAKYGRPTDKPLGYERLMRRDALTRWLHAQFFKLVIPAKRQDTRVAFNVAAPLNVTMLFNLIRRLHDIGYPAHWLSAILRDIMSGTVASQKRAPTRTPYSPRDLEEKLPLADIVTSPFVPELKTLYPIFEPLLPFRLEQLQLELPTIQNLVRCTFAMPSFSYGPQAQANVLALVFWPKPYIPKSTDSGVSMLRPMLSMSKAEIPKFVEEFSSMLPRSSPAAVDEDFTKHVALWSSFEWHATRKSGAVVMEESYYDMLVAKDWICALWRTDQWKPVVKDFLPVSEAFSGKCRWVEYVDAEKAGIS